MLHLRMFRAGVLVAVSCAGPGACGGFVRAAVTNDAGDEGDAPPLHDGPDSGVGAPDGAAPDGGQLGNNIDASLGEAGPPNMPGSCGVVAPRGTQLVASTASLVLQGHGTTSDGYAFYEDTDAQQLYAIRTAGGPALPLGAMTSQEGTFHINGAAALFLPAAPTPTTNVASLSAWSSKAGVSAIATDAYAFDKYYSTYDISPDGAYAAYLATSDGLTGTLVVATIGGLSKAELVPNIALNIAGCAPSVQFVTGTIVAQYCLRAPSDDASVSGDAGHSSLLITSFAAPAFGATKIGEFAAPDPRWPAGPPTVSPDGTQLLYSAATNAELFPVAGGASTLVDPQGNPQLFAPNGDLIYLTAAGTPTRYSRGVGSVGVRTPIGAGAVDWIEFLSPDGAWLEGERGADVAVFSATGPSAPTPPFALGDGGVSLAGFSADSKFAVIETNFPSTHFGIRTFDVDAVSVSGGPAVKVLTAAGTFLFASGSRVLANDHPNSATGSTDIESIDLNSPTVVSTLVTQADPNFYYLPSTNEVLYTWHCAANGYSGLWTAPAP